MLVKSLVYGQLWFTSVLLFKVIYISDYKVKKGNCCTTPFFQKIVFKNIYFDLFRSNFREVCFLNAKIQSAYSSVFDVLKCLSYMLIKIPNTVFYNSFILLTLYESSNQKLKIYNTLTLKFYGSRDADYIHRWKSAKSQERK